MRPAFRPPPTPHSPPHVPTPPPPPPHPPGAASALPPPCPRRSAYVPEETRSTIINCFRIPLNLFVCVVLYNVSSAEGGGLGGRDGHGYGCRVPHCAGYVCATLLSGSAC